MDKVLPLGATVGFLGSGQLAKMGCAATAQLGYQSFVYSDVGGCAFDAASKYSCSKYGSHYYLQQFVEACDVITTEFENIPLKTIDLIDEISGGKVPFYPGRKALEVAQDRLLEKQLARELGIATPNFWPVEKDNIPDDIVYPVIVKTRRMGYDGKGQRRVKSKDELVAALAEFDADPEFKGIPCIAEEIIQFAFEVSVITARGLTGEVGCYPLFCNRHEDGILAVTSWPLDNADVLRTNAHSIATKLAHALEVIGLLAVEMFVTRYGLLFFNEIAPRPHNSGHLTIECAVTSQFTQHIRAIVGLPLGSFDPICHGRMVNMIGDCQLAEEAWKDPKCRVTRYNKGVRARRKVGHIVYLEPVNGFARPRIPEAGRTGSALPRGEFSFGT